MDTSDTYYKMCSGAFPRDAKRGICLKTQDQLQEMAQPIVEQQDLHYIGAYRLAGRFTDFLACHNQALDNIDVGECSMEQLWLAFVMKVKYGKVWNGDNWIKE